MKIFESGQCESEDLVPLGESLYQMMIEPMLSMITEMVNSKCLELEQMLDQNLETTPLLISPISLVSSPNHCGEFGCREVNGCNNQHKVESRNVCDSAHQQSGILDHMEMELCEM